MALIGGLVFRLTHYRKSELTIRSTAFLAAGKLTWKLDAAGFSLGPDERAPLSNSVGKPDPSAQH